MEAPVIVVTGPIASGKSTIASVIAEKGGLLVEADSLARKVYRDPSLKDRLRERFGKGVFTPSGEVSRARLGARVFSSEKDMRDLNRMVKAEVTGLIEEKIREGRKSHAYIVLDAVLYFHYKFSFKPALVVTASASAEVRAGRLKARNRLGTGKALERIRSQQYLEKGWSGADIVIDTDRSIEEVRREAADIRDSFLIDHGITGE